MDLRLGCSLVVSLWRTPQRTRFAGPVPTNELGGPAAIPTEGPLLNNDCSREVEASLERKRGFGAECNVVPPSISSRAKGAHAQALMQMRVALDSEHRKAMNSQGTGDL
jgi:hypothetical protein